jgi:hypothetical protein
MRPNPNWLTIAQQRQLSRGQFCPQEPLIFNAYRGNKATDVLWSDSIDPFFFSVRLLTLLIDQGISGWNTYPVELYNRQRERLDSYMGIAITGPECQRDRSRSEIVDKPPPVLGGQGYQVYRGLYFDESQWDGSDLFRVNEGGGIVVTDRVHRLFHMHKIRNAKFTPLPEVEIRVAFDKYGESAKRS